MGGLENEKERKNEEWLTHARKWRRTVDSEAVAGTKRFTVILSFLGDFLSYSTPKWKNEVKNNYIKSIIKIKIACIWRSNNIIKCVNQLWFWVWIYLITLNI